MRVNIKLPTYDTFRNLLELTRCFGVPKATRIRVADMLDNSKLGYFVDVLRTRSKVIITTADTNRANVVMSSVISPMLDALIDRVMRGEATIPSIEQEDAMRIPPMHRLTPAMSWVWMLNEMSWAHRMMTSDWETQYYTQTDECEIVESDVVAVDPTTGLSSGVFNITNVHENAHRDSSIARTREQIQQGLTWFGKYYRFLEC